MVNMINDKTKYFKVFTSGENIRKINDLESVYKIRGMWLFVDFEQVWNTMNKPYTFGEVDLPR